MKRFLLTSLITLLVLLVAAGGALGWALYTNSGASFILGRIAGELPGQLRWSALEGSLAAELRLQQLSYEDESVHVTIRHLAAGIRPRFMPFALDLPLLRAQGLVVTPKPSTEPSPPLTPDQLLEMLALPIEISFSEASLHDVELRGDSGATHFESIEWRGSWSNAIDLPHLKLRFDDQAWQSELRASLARPFGLRGRVESGTPRAVQLSFDGTPNELDMTYRTAVDENLAIQGRVTLALGLEVLSFSELEVQVDDSPLQVRGEGSVNLEEQTLTGDLYWRHFQWPLHGEEPDLASPSGKASLRGNLDDWHAGIEGELHAAGLESDLLVLKAHGDADSAQADISQARFLGGTLSGTASADWSGELNWAAEIQAVDVATEPLVPELPGRISLDASARGEAGAERVDIVVRDLRAVLRDVPIQAAGGIRLLAGDWRAESFEVRSGRSRVLANGNPRDDRGLDLEITALDLALLPLEISGLVNGRMFLQLAEDRIEHRIDLDASGIAYGGLAADTLHIRPRDDGGLNLDAVGVRRGDGDPANLSVQLKGHALGSDVDLQAHTEGLSLQAELRGKLSGWQDPGQVRWDGNLSRMSLLPANHPGLHLQQAAPLKLSAQSISISSACVTGVGDSVLCLESEWNAAGHFNGRADLHEFSLDSIAWLPERAFQMTQVANGTLELGWRNGQSLTGQGRVNLSPGLVHLAEDEELVIRTGEGVIRFAIRDDSLLDGQIDLELPGNGLIDIDFSLPDVVNAPLDDVNGRVRVQLADVGAIWRLAPIFDTLDGALDLDLEVTGGLGQPNIAGQVSFTDGLFVHEASGLTLGQINLAGNLNNQQLSRISGTFQAGEGRGDIDLELDLADMTSAGMVIHLKGEKLTLIDVPSLKLVANPDLGARFEEGLIQVDGRIYVPETVISPTRLPSEAATESDDVRIVAGQPSVRSPDAEPMEEFAITGTVELELGPGVRLDIDVAELGLSGKTRFTWEGRKVPTANGQFNLAGEILAFGQRLEVTSGRIGFPDVPADNPHLNIRAERQIWGNPQVQRAGLMITGTLNQMVSEPYTVPLTTRERAQTLLVTGSDFDYDQGVGAVSAGMYVLPRLYLSYGIGVFERGNVISARYDISERFGVKATSGEKDTGMDITYTIEK